MLLGSGIATGAAGPMFTTSESSPGPPFQMYVYVPGARPKLLKVWLSQVEAPERGAPDM